MSDQQWRIGKLEEDITHLEKEVRELTRLRDQLIGMGSAAKWGYRALLVAGGYGAIDGVKHLIAWLTAPVPKGN